VCKHVFLSPVYFFDKQIELETPLNVGILREGHMIIIIQKSYKISQSRNIRTGNSPECRNSEGGQHDYYNTKIL
jgi:hypothetical protein